MTNWNDASKMLAAPLHPSVVKTREQGGTKVSYVEGWHVIDEANRIFGFDGWTRETIETKCVSERERKMGKNKDRDGFGVSYTAKVRVVAGGIARDGTGAGHGVDADCGQAHESAIKEAETDAMKRALMTFGNPFGLALYDKDKTNVSAEPVADYDTIVSDLIQVVEQCSTSKELSDLKDSERFKSEQNSLPEMQFKKLADAYRNKKAALLPKAA